MRPQTARRWFLEPDHPERRAIRDQVTGRRLARRFDLQPNDFLWLPGEKAARKREQQARRAA